MIRLAVFGFALSVALTSAAQAEGKSLLEAPRFEGEGWLYLKCGVFKHFVDGELVRSSASNNQPPPYDPLYVVYFAVQLNSTYHLKDRGIYQWKGQSWVWPPEHLADRNYQINIDGNSIIFSQNYGLLNSNMEHSYNFDRPSGLLSINIRDSDSRDRLYSDPRPVKRESWYAYCEKSAPKVELKSNKF